MRKRIKYGWMLAVLLLPAGLLAQNQDQPKVKKPVNEHKVNFGAKVGLNVSQLSTRISDFYNENYLGFKGGVFARFNIKKLHIQPELNFSMVGGEGTFGNGTGGSYSVKVNTLELPIMVGYKVLDFKIVNVRLAGGVFGAYNLSRSIVVNDPNYPANNNFSNDRAASWNAGFLVGGGVDIWRITVDLRYQWGLVNLMGENIFQQDYQAGFKHGTFEISAGFKIF